MNTQYANQMPSEYANQMPTAAKRDVNPDSFASTAEQANGRMGDFLGRLSMLTDRLCGSAPPSGEAGIGGVNSIRGVPNGHFDEAADNSRAIMLKLEAANRCLDRIERALP